MMGEQVLPLPKDEYRCARAALAMAGAALAHQAARGADAARSSAVTRWLVKSPAVAAMAAKLPASLIVVGVEAPQRRRSIARRSPLTGATRVAPATKARLVTTPAAARFTRSLGHLVARTRGPPDIACRQKEKAAYELLEAAGTQKIHLAETSQTSGLSSVARKHQRRCGCVMSRRYRWC